MSNPNQYGVGAEEVIDFAKNNQELARDAGQAVGRVAYDNREAIGNYAYENREYIADQAYQHREEIAQAAYQNQDYVQEAAAGYMDQQQQDQYQQDPYQQQNQQQQQNTSYANTTSVAAQQPVSGGGGANPGSSNPNLSSSKRKARPPKGGIQGKILNKCTGNVLITANIGGLGLCGVGCAVRFVYIFAPSEEPKPADYNAVIFFLSTTFFVLFIVLAALSLLKVENKVGLFVRSNFHFLDYYLGRGLFLLFIGLFLLEMPDALDYIFFAVVCVIVIVDLVVGCQEYKIRKEAADASGDAQQWAAQQQNSRIPNQNANSAAVDLAGANQAAAQEHQPEPQYNQNAGSRAHQYQVQEPAAASGQNIQMQNFENLDQKPAPSEDGDPYDV